MTATLVIVRHGDTFAPGEVPRRIGARTDLPLVASGRAQAVALGEHLAAAGGPFGRILCSPLRRTRETAEAIRAALPGTPPVEPFDLLAEVDHGPDEDRPEAEVVARIGEGALVAWDRDGTPPPHWAVDRDARLAGWRALLAGANGTTLFVTSNGAARFALLAAPGLADGLSSLKLRTGAYGVIRVENGRPRRIAWDRRP